MQILTEEIQTVCIKASGVNIIARDKEAFCCQEFMMIVNFDLELII